MSERHETIADIIAEKRREANYIVQVSQGKCQTRRDKAEDEARDIRREADRLEAAHRREVAVSKTETTTGDAKMREALKKIDEIVWDKRRHTKEETEAHRIATEVLTAVHSTSPEPIGGDCAELRGAISNLRTALKEIRNDVLDMVTNYKSEDPDSYAHGLCLSIGGACDMALNSTKEFDNADK